MGGDVVVTSLYEILFWQLIFQGSTQPPDLGIGIMIHKEPLYILALPIVHPHRYGEDGAILKKNSFLHTTLLGDLCQCANSRTKCVI